MFWLRATALASALLMYDRLVHVRSGARRVQVFLFGMQCESATLAELSAHLCGTSAVIIDDTVSAWLPSEHLMALRVKRAIALSAGMDPIQHLEFLLGRYCGGEMSVDESGGIRQSAFSQLDYAARCLRFVLDGLRGGQGDVGALLARGIEKVKVDEAQYAHDVIVEHELDEAAAMQSMREHEALLEQQWLASGAR